MQATGLLSTGPGRAVGRLESHFVVPHPNPEVSAGESIEVHAWLRAEWVRKINALCKRRENWGGEVWSCLYTQMRLLETGWLEIGHDQFHHLGKGGAVKKNCTQLRGTVNVFACIWFFIESLTEYFLLPHPQNIKVTIMDQGATMTSSPTALHPRRLSPRPSPLTSLVLGPELWRDQATILQTTKGSRTWYPMQKPPVQNRAYRTPCSRSRGRRTGADQVPLSPWQVTPATALQCPTKARRWEKPQPGKKKKGDEEQGPFPGWISAQLIQEKKSKMKTTLFSAKYSLNFYGGLFEIMDWFSQLTNWWAWCLNQVYGGGEWDR